MSNTIALIAHNSRKDDMVRFASAHLPTLSRYSLTATTRTGEQIQAATGLSIEQKLTASLGGIVQIAAEVVSGTILAVIFLNAAPPTSVLAQRAGQVLMNDELLDVTIATAESKVEAVTTMLRLLGAAIAKTELNQKNVIHGRTRRLKVTTNPPQKVVVDGELIGTTPIDVECIPSDLTVFVPETLVLS